MAILGGGERDLTIRLFANVKDFTKNMDDATKNTQAFSGKAIETLGKVGLAVGAAAAAVGGFALKLGVDSVKAAIEAQKQQERLAILLRNTGGATEAQIQTLNAQAIALSKVGVATRDNVTITQSQLATFDLKAGTIAKLTPAILDYVIAEKGATASTDDFRSMTNGLAQALQGNFASLTATGFVLDEATKATIKNGTETERTAALVEVLNSTYEGFNETVGETAEGQLVRLQNAFEDTKVKIGEALLPELLLLLEAFRENVLPEIEKFTDFIIEETIPAIKEYLTPQIERLVGTMLGLVEAFDETTRAVVPTRDGVNFLTAYVQEVALAVWEGFLNVINGIGVALTELTRILGFFAVLFTQFDLDKAIEVLNFEQYRLNNTVGDAQREFLKYQQQLDTTTNSLASAYRELRFYNNFKKEIALPTTKTETELLQEQIETLKAQLAAANAAGEGAKKFAAAQADKKKSVDDTSLSLKMQLAILRDIGGASFAAAGGANIRSGATLQESVRSSADIVSQFGGFIGGFNLNPSDPFFGFGQGSDIGTFKRGSGGTVNINVNGTVIDPEGAARAISDLLVRGSGRAGDLPIFTPLGAS